MVNELVKEGNGNVSEKNEKSRRFNTFLITNRHILEDNRVKDIGSIIVRFRTKQDGQTIEYEIPLVNRKKSPPQLWIGHHDGGDIDVAAIRLDGDQFKEEGWNFDDFPLISPRVTDKGFMTIEQMNDENIAECDPIYIPGYPMGLVHADWTDVTILYGYIAQIRGALKRRNPTFVIDASLILGNSGSPVILQSRISQFVGRGFRNQEQLDELTGGGKVIAQGNIIGIVSKGKTVKGEPCEEKLITGWNARLVRVFPSDNILEMIRECNDKEAVAMKRCA